MRVLILVAFILSSCSSNINLSGVKNLNFLPLERSSYKVKKGDTLWTIAIKSNNDPLRIAKKNNLKNLKNASQIANNISSNLGIQIFEKQELLEIIDLKKRLEKMQKQLKTT